MKRTPWHVRTGAIVLAWLAVSAVAAAWSLVGDVSHWLLVHLLLLGAVSNAILVWSSHFAAALLRLPDTGRTILAGFVRMRFSSRAASSAFFRTDQVIVAVFGL